MGDLTWNQFRQLHTGVDKEEMSSLWQQYKDGEYEAPQASAAEETPVEDNVETNPQEESTVEEVGEEERREAFEEKESIDYIQQFHTNFNLVYNGLLDKESEKMKTAKQLLKEAAAATVVKGYKCEPTDGWKLWLGPTKAAVLCNESKDVAFACNRNWWQTFYHGSSLCYVETCDQAEQVFGMKNYFKKRGRFVERVPIPSFEIMLPASRMEIINTASGSWD